MSLLTVMNIIVVAIVTLSATTTTFVNGQPDYTCDILNESCPSAFNGVCDSDAGPNPLPGCETNDCSDCDLCEQFHYDCNGCLNAIGCFWCPGDATCFNSPYYSFPPEIRTSCTRPSDYEENGSCAKPENFFNDPLYDAQEWVYDMIDVRPVWEQGIFGTGVRVRINDEGIESENIEFSNRYDSDASCTGFDRPFSSVERPELAARSHGTTVASIVGGEADNDHCAAGIAPGVTLSSCNIHAPNSINSQLQVLAYKLDQFDISQNSFGVIVCPLERRRRREEEVQEDEEKAAVAVASSHDNRNLQTCPFTYPGPYDGIFNPCLVCGNDVDFTDTLTPQCETIITVYCTRHYEQDPSACLDFIDLLIGGMCEYAQLSDVAPTSIATGIRQGRNGKGIVYVFAAGNSFALGDDTNFSGLVNTRLTISVGAVGQSGFHASYSTPGAALFISAPGGDNDALTNHMVAALVEGGGQTCRGASPGTSFAAPVVSGVVALMLEVNPDLSWRDVQGILAETSTEVNGDPYDDTKITNGAGFVHSNLYGFGIVNASAAVETAKNWQLWDDEKMIYGESGIIDLPISDEPANEITSSTISITEEMIPTTSPTPSTFVMESAVVLLDLQHFTRGDLDIILTSPSGTSSILHPGKRLENTQLSPNERWKLMTVRNWGESPIGQWTLSIQDRREGEIGTCADAPYVVPYGGQNVTCEYLENGSFCVNDAINPDTLGNGSLDPLLAMTYDGLTLEEACCACGGGLTSAQFVNELTQWRLVLYGRNVGPTASPTGNPTSEPTNVPTSEPTNVPTTSPTGRPTSKPTTSPTGGPTSKPTTSPTGGPTSGPTVGPTASPTGGPTSKPTIGSTPSPTSGPTTSPTGGPTSGPTVGSTPSPTGGPTTSPTGRPTVSPTSGPTTSPTGGPTVSPTGGPTGHPTNTSTSTPTSSPTGMTPKTPSPTQNSTSKPSTPPTTTPTIAPTSSPTKTPTSTPTTSPTATPTSMPTKTPTSTPTSSPTTSPTTAPTLLPTKMPTSSPTKTPTSSPTATSPTSTPTSKPTMEPSPIVDIGSNIAPFDPWEDNEVTLFAEMGKYPGYVGELNPRGTVRLIFEFNSMMEIKMYTFTGVEKNVTGAGFAIHEGMTCNDASEVGSHYWNSDKVVDLWNEGFGAVYNTLPHGKPIGGFFTYNGYSVDENVGHAVVAYAVDGTRIACGILQYLNL